MKIELQNLIIENFKGLKHFQTEFDGQNAEISAENGIGKTTVFDAFLWLLFGKDSTGRKDFEITPLDKNNQPLRGLVTSVTTELSIDDEFHVFKKSQEENIVKGQLRGYTTLCWIDDVPKKVGEYNDFIAKLIDEDTFKLLTDLDYFNGKLHWKDRRKVLMNFAGDYDAPKGFEKLHGLLNNRSIDDYKKVLKTQKDGYVKERDEINPRIDETQRSLETYATEDALDTKALEAQRTAITKEISGLRVKRQELMGQETKRQEKMTAINDLKDRRANREYQLHNDTSGIKILLDEKQDLEIQLGRKQQEVSQIKNHISQTQSEISNCKVKLDSCLSLRSELNNQYLEIKNTVSDNTCYACGQVLPANKLAEIEAGKQKKLADIVKHGTDQNNAVKTYTAQIETLNESIQTLTKSLEQANVELVAMTTAKAQRFTEIDEAIKNNPTTPPEKDAIWLSFSESIKKFETELGEPIGVQLENIESERIRKESALEKVNSLLNNVDNIAKANKRITELKARESELSQLIADIEGQLAMIDDYNIAESKAIEKAINSMFNYVEFKLFDYFLNGEIKECCEAMFNGVPYNDLSTGQKIFVGLDIVNVLSKHYGMSVPLFIDHLESLTLPIESESQIIGLKAVEDIKELTIKAFMTTQLQGV